MTDQVPCAHEDVYWQLDAAQEQGWRCLACRASLGFRPDLDRTHTFCKVEAILHDLHNAGLTYVSNSTEGYQLVRQVTTYCHTGGVYDQQSIAHYLLDDQEHRAFWQKEARRWMDEHREQT